MTSWFCRTAISANGVALADVETKVCLSCTTFFALCHRMTKETEELGDNCHWQFLHSGRNTVSLQMVLDFRKIWIELTDYHDRSDDLYGCTLPTTLPPEIHSGYGWLAWILRVH